MTELEAQLSLYQGTQPDWRAQCEKAQAVAAEAIKERDKWREKATYFGKRLGEEMKSADGIWKRMHAAEASRDRLLEGLERIRGGGGPWSGAIASEILAAEEGAAS